MRLYSERCLSLYGQIGARDAMDRSADSATIDGSEGWSGAGSALHQAAAHGRGACVVLLLNAGANVEATPRLCPSLGSWTPLMEAARYGHTGCVVRLLEAKARVDAVASANGFELYKAGDTALHLACRPALRRGQRLDPRDCNGLTIAWYGILASGGGDERPRQARVVHELIARGAADFERANELGETPLALAAVEGHVDCVRMLLFFGAQRRNVAVSQELALSVLDVARGAAAAHEEGGPRRMSDADGGALLRVAYAEVISLLTEKTALESRVDEKRVTVQTTQHPNGVTGQTTQTTQSSTTAVSVVDSQSLLPPSTFPGYHAFDGGGLVGRPASLDGMSAMLAAEGPPPITLLGMSAPPGSTLPLYTHLYLHYRYVLTDAKARRIQIVTHPTESDDGSNADHTAGRAREVIMPLTLVEQGHVSQLMFVPLDLEFVKTGDGGFGPHWSHNEEIQRLTSEHSNPYAHGVVIDLPQPVHWRELAEAAGVKSATDGAGLAMLNHAEQLDQWDSMQMRLNRGADEHLWLGGEGAPWNPWGECEAIQLAKASDSLEDADGSRATAGGCCLVA